MVNMQVLSLFIVSAAFSTGLSVTVTTPVGDVEGFVEGVSVHGRAEIVRKFLGIPYAEPPTGERRFAKPVPKTRFSTTFKALDHGHGCYELDPTVKIMSEDCLFLDIYSPDRPSGSEVFPVMIWIHGGGFTIGSSIIFPGEYFSVKGQVILVNVKYRLAELGFMSTMNSEMPGNFGLWDQHLAIKWVNENIAAFGGDPSRVTIFGESAGSACVVYQSLYPGNLGLFQRVIGESGSATAMWARKSPSVAVDSANKFAKAIGCSRPTSAETLKCLRAMSAAEVNKTMNGDDDVAKEWAPVVDNDFVLDIPEKIVDGTSKATAAINMFKSVDLIIGTNNFDGAASAPKWMELLNKTDMKGLQVPKQDFEDILIPYHMHQFYETELPDIVNKIAVLKYTDWSDPNNDTKRMTRLSDISTDVIFKVPMVDVVDGHARHSQRSTYAYEFSLSKYPSHIIPTPSVFDKPGMANHADEIPYLFGGGNQTENVITANFSRLSVSQKAVTLRVTTAMITMWTNFAKTGNPNQPVDATSIINVIWPQYGAEENYLEITATMTSQSVRQRLAPKAVDFFKKVVPAVVNATQCKACHPSIQIGTLIG